MMRFSFTVLVLAFAVNPASAWNPFDSNLDKFEDISEEYSRCQSNQGFPSQCIKEKKEHDRLWNESIKDGYTLDQMYAAQNLGWSRVPDDDGKSKYKTIQSFFTSFDELNDISFSDDDYKLYLPQYCNKITYKPELFSKTELNFFNSLDPSIAETFLLRQNKTLLALKLVSLRDDGTLVFTPDNQGCQLLSGPPRISKETYLQLKSELKNVTIKFH